VIEGQGLHSGARATVSFARREGPSVIRRGERAVRLDALEVVDTTRSTTVADRERTFRVATVEHLFAALASHGARDGVEIAIDGPEIPLADGGARAFADAIRALERPPSPPALVVARRAAISIGESVYELEPGEGVAVEVDVDFGDARLARRASWSGDASDFRERIATARTFGFEHEVEDLLARGLATHVAPESVVVVCTDRVLSAGAPFAPDEPARHKLLDLLGDAYLHGGPPRGRLHVTRPGHARNHEAFRRALNESILQLVVS
jgi:UDP-3-O-[3-hydroxymyristoyl] N-acetylglucosamine deacetylase